MVHKVKHKKGNIKNRLSCLFSSCFDKNHGVSLSLRHFFCPKNGERRRSFHSLVKFAPYIAALILINICWTVYTETRENAIYTVQQGCRIYEFYSSNLAAEQLVVLRSRADGIFMKSFLIKTILLFRKKIPDFWFRVNLESKVRFFYALNWRQLLQFDLSRKRSRILFVLKWNTCPFRTLRACRQLSAAVTVFCSDAFPCTCCAALFFGACFPFGFLWGWLPLQTYWRR